ncbi:MAG TPA: hypothetical protein VI248_10515 [Kineosporiaceae bacterium]
MPAVPRVRHVLPSGPVTRAVEPVPVVALITWRDGKVTPEDAAALAWTRGEVLVAWTTPWGTPYQVWVPAAHVQRRPGTPSSLRRP